MNMAVALSPHIVKKISKWIKDSGDCTDEDQQQSFALEL